MLEQRINQVRKIKRELSYWLDDTKRLLLQSFSNQDYINQKEFRIVGLKRSGSHGIITWIRRHYQERVWHLNDIAPGRNPYRHLYENYSRAALKQEAKGNFSQKKCLIYNYENYTFESIINSLLEKKHDLYLGKSQTRYDLLILRDPYNTFASMLQGQRNDNKFSYLHTLPKNKKTITELWLDYAKEFLGETNYFQNKKVTINYNQWICNQQYRKDISEQLGLNFCDLGFNVVKDYGGGSSFQGTYFDQKASIMDVQNRWQKFVDDREYRKILSAEVIAYSQKIFGHIEGTEALIN